jgi:hypothetical protein
MAVVAPMDLTYPPLAGAFGDAVIRDDHIKKH